MNIQPLLVERLKKRIGASSRSAADKTAVLEQRVSVLESLVSKQLAPLSKARGGGSSAAGGYQPAIVGVGVRAGPFYKMALRTRLYDIKKGEVLKAPADNQARKELAERKRIYLRETVSPEEMRAELSELCK
ncbi:MAG: hypothetical protein WC091_15910 [Sulfuricellaceae bacterium]